LIVLAASAEVIMPEAVLKGRVALVTGVSRRKGIGFAIAQKLAAMGADVFIHSFSTYDADRDWGADPNGVPALIAELQTQGTRIAHAEGNFLDPLVPQQLMNAAVKEFGHIDILVANHTYSTLGNLEELTATQIDTHFQVNVRGTLLLTQAFANQHQKSTGGRVVLLTSGQHLTPMPTELAYVASKGAIHQLTMSLSAHLIELYEFIRAANPQGRWGEPEDAARLIGWLATDDAQWMTGQILNSNGGGY
jgi:3-oxoacyl-[acyl-carrier protein] reductase